MLTDELNFTLPPELIATEPAVPRDSARLLVINRAAQTLAHHHVRDLPTLGLFGPNDLLIFNQSKVVPAYFELTRTATGGHVTGLYLGSPSADTWSVLLESRGKLQPGESLHFNDDSKLTLTTRCENGRWLAECHSPLSHHALLDQVGSPPLPPYIRKQRQAMNLPPLQQDDSARYNTVYASEAGSVAAPTAGLHFTPELLAALDTQGVSRAHVTLHVGLGTFAPIRTDRVEDHAIHSETCSVSQSTLKAIARTRAAGGRIIPVGTTTVRTLESLPRPLPNGDSTDGSTGVSAGDITMDTNLFITPAEPAHDGRPARPAFDFRFADMLMTNFHLPRSSLLALVASLPGVDVPTLKQWYAQAIEHKYRFYSYGDAMIIV